MKKNIKNVSGFTLIELLAVIVVLAIIILMASMAVIPRMNQARRQVFSMEANEALDAASSYWLDATINGTKNTFPINNETKCVTIAQLRTSGDFTGGSDYSGVIYVHKKDATTNTYEYAITMGNGNLMVVNAGISEDVKPTNVKDYVKATIDTAIATCTDGKATKFPTESGD